MFVVVLCLFVVIFHLFVVASNLFEVVMYRSVVILFVCDFLNSLCSCFTSLLVLLYLLVVLLCPLYFSSLCGCNWSCLWPFCVSLWLFFISLWSCVDNEMLTVISYMGLWSRGPGPVYLLRPFGNPSTIQKKPTNHHLLTPVGGHQGVQSDFRRGVVTHGDPSGLIHADIPSAKALWLLQQQVSLMRCKDS